jgi:hypothetical protein
MDSHTPTQISTKTSENPDNTPYNSDKKITGYNSIISEIGGRVILDEEHAGSIGKSIASFHRQLTTSTPKCDIKIEIYETDVIDDRISLKTLTAATTIEADSNIEAIRAIPNKLTKQVDVGRMKFELYEKGLDGVAYEYQIGDSCKVMLDDDNCINGYISGFESNEGYRPSTVIVQPEKPEQNGYPPIPKSIRVTPDDII